MDRPYPLIAIAALALLGFGIVMVASAGIGVIPASELAPVASEAPRELLPKDAPEPLTIDSVLKSRTTLYAGLALTAMTVGAILPVRRLARWLGIAHEGHAPAKGRPSPLVTNATLALGTLAIVVPILLVYTPLGHEVNFSRRWLAVGPVTFQPSELAKWGVIALVAWFAARRLAERGVALQRFFKDLLPVSVALGVVVLVIMKEDLGTAALVAAVGGVVLLAAGMRWLHLALTVPPALAVIALGILAEPYRRTRIMSFLNPWDDPADTGYHMIQSMAAVAGGDVTGRGLGHGIRKFGYLPEDTTDFIFAIVCEELGVIGALLVLFMYAVLLAALVQVAWRERHAALQLFTIGMAATIGFQASINIAVVTGLAPTKGIALPLISHGGTGWILTAFCLGLTIAISRTQPTTDEPTTHASPVPA